MTNIKPINLGSDDDVSFWANHPRLREFKWAVEDRIDKILSPLWKIKTFVLKMFAYAPILWRDRDFDWAFILTILQFKLKRTREYLVEENIIGDIDKISSEIKQAEDIIDEIFKDDFCKEEHEAHTAKWGEHKDNFVPTKNGALRWDMSREKAITPEEKEQERKEIMEIYELEEKRMGEAWDRLFTHLKANIRGWWS